MIEIVVNPVFEVTGGGLVISGKVNVLDYEILWKRALDNEFSSIGVIKTDERWSIDYPLSDNNDVVTIKAVSPKGENTTNIDVSLTTGANGFEASFQFNELDDLAIDAYQERFPAETNRSFRSRVIESMTLPGNSSDPGLRRGISRDIGLPQFDRFFQIKVRYNHITRSPYKDVFVTFETNRCTVQFEDWIIDSEPAELDLITYRFRPSKRIGFGNVKVINGTHEVPNTLWNEIDDETIEVDRNYIDPSKIITISYPYRKVLEYFYKDAVTGEQKVRTVSEIKNFIQQADQVLDEFGFPRSTIVWTDGYFELVNQDLLATVTYETKVSEQQMYDLPPSVLDYVKVANGGDLYKFNRTITNKGSFLSSQINIINYLELNENPFQVSASLINMENFHDKNFQKRLIKSDGTHTGSVLESKALELRNLARVGVEKMISDKDSWGMDMPKRIGNHVLPSKFDGNYKPYEFVKSDGTTIKMNLNQRRHNMRKISRR